MKNNDIEVLMNVKEHEVMIDVLSYAVDAFHFTHSTSTEHYTTLENMRQSFLKSWAERFEE